MWFKLLLLVFMIVSTYCASAREIINDASVDSRQPEMAKHHSNHPLLPFENPIPVAVIYEDEHKISVRSEIKTEASNSEDAVENTENFEESLETSTEEVITTTKAKNDDNKIKLKLNPQAFTYRQIPVAVVYDDLYNKNTLKPKTDVNTEIPSRYANRRENQQIKNTHKDSKEQTTQRVKEPEKHQQIFRKRTGGKDPIVPIIESESYVFSHSGNFHYNYEAGDGTKAYSEGKLKSVAKNAGESVVGGFSYKDNDGNDFSVSYTADENGYRPVGAHLPTPPPIPPEIARALQYLATATPEPVVTKTPKTSKKPSDDNY